MPDSDRPFEIDALVELMRSVYPLWPGGEFTGPQGLPRRSYQGGIGIEGYRLGETSYRLGSSSRLGFEDGKYGLVDEGARTGGEGES
jgi:hypothetical protein